jgi:hypothetical protein
MKSRTKTEVKRIYAEITRDLKRMANEKYPNTAPNGSRYNDYLICLADNVLPNGNSPHFDVINDLCFEYNVCFGELVSVYNSIKWPARLK